MTTITSDKYIVIEPSVGGSGIKIRSAAGLKELIAELLHNSGEEIAIWAEGEAKRAADAWRVRMAQEARRSCNRHDDCDKAETEFIQRKYPQAVTPMGIADKRMYLPVDFHCHDDECEECFGN